MPRECSIGIIDLQFLSETRSTIDDMNNPYFQGFIDTWKDTIIAPDFHCPHVWLRISKSIDRNAQAMAHASTNTKHEYLSKISNYMPCNNKYFNSIAEGKVFKKHQVPLIFFIERSSPCANSVNSIADIFKAPKLPLYTKAGIYTEQVLCLRSSKLRLEFSCQVLKLFLSPSERFLLMAGIKPMLVDIVSSVHRIFNFFIWLDSS